MQTPNGKEVTRALRRPNRLVRTNEVVIAERGRPTVIILAVEEYERLRAPQATGTASMEKNMGKTTEE